jgi:glycolate oxidase FAD binding subunit
MVLTPESGADVAATLRRAADARQAVLIRGAGTKLEWARPGSRADTVLDMRRLNRVLAHEHGDLTATIEAGAALADVNRALAAHGQWLPLDPPHADRATIGGILATNDSGPLRHRYGTPRDLLIGITLATADGVMAHAGGRVVKNVAGYDLGKLVTGSFGALAAIVTATFKLSPLPAASRTLRLEAADADALARIVRAVMASQLEPIAFEVVVPGQLERPNGASDGFQLLLRFASLRAAVDAQIERAIDAVGNDSIGHHVAGDDDERLLWRAHGERIWEDQRDAAIVRASWLPAHTHPAVGEMSPFAAIGRAAVGAGLIRVTGDAEAQVRAIERFRVSRVLGNVVVARASTDVRARVDVWPPAGDRQPLFNALKRALDPHNVLNPARGPL